MSSPHRLRGLGLLIALCMALVAASVTAQERPSLPLTATHTTADGRLTFSYPGGWFAADNSGAAIIGSNIAAIDPLLTLPVGEVRADLYAAPISVLPDVEDNARLEDILSVAVAQASQSSCPPYSAPETISVAGLSAVRAGQTCNSVERLFIVVRIDANTVSVLGGSTVAGSMGKFASTLAEVAASARYVPPASLDSTAVDTGPLTENFVSASGDIQFRLPSGWRTAEDENVIGITDGEGAIFPQPPSNQLAVRIRIVRADALPPDNRGNPASAVRWLLSVSNDGTPYGQPASFSIGDLLAARARGLSANAETMVFAAQLDAATYALFSVRAVSGSMRQVEPLLYALATTIEVAPDADLGETTQVASTPTPPPPTMIPGTIAATFEPLEAQEVSTVGIELAETFTHPLGTYAFNYPSGWLVEETLFEGGRGMVITPNHSFEPGIPAPGQPFGYLILGSLQQVLGDNTPADLQQAALDALPIMAMGTNAPYGSFTPMLLDGRLGASAVATLPDVENTVFIVLLNDDAFAYLSVFLAPGDLAIYGPQFLASLSSVTVETGMAALPTATAVPPTPTATPNATPDSGPVLSQTLTTSTGVVISYPEGWFTSEADGVLTLSNVASLEIAGEGDDLNAAPGQYQFTISQQPADGAALIDVLTANAGAFAVGPAIELKSGKYTGQGMAIDVGVLSGTLAVFPVEDQYLIVTVFYNPADTATIATLLNAIVSAVDLPPFIFAAP
jgi:hypothetical protein